jgi:sulfonate transport system substrate-binding protein
MYLIRVLNEAGLTFDDIEPLNSTIPEGLAGVVTGDIDAAVFQIGQGGDLIADGTIEVVHNAFTADKDVYYEPTVFIARTEAYQENKEVAVAIQKALLKAKDGAKQDVDAYFANQSEKSGLALEIVLASAEKDLDISSPLSLDDKYLDSLKDILQFLKDNELTTGDIDYDTWIDHKYVVDKAAEEYASEK